MDALGFNKDFKQLRAEFIGCYIFSLVIALTGCAGKHDYINPTSEAKLNNSIVIDRSKDEVWKELIPELGKHFFVINNLDKASGLINISYSGDPEAYIDCGRVVSYVQNLKGERTYDFPAARAQQTYEVMDGRGLWLISRNMTLEGRMNLVFEEMTPNQTRVTANTRYIVTRNMSQQLGGTTLPSIKTDTISINSGQSAGFANPDGSVRPICLPNGKFEADVLALIKNQKR